jgi:hypothetical protein
MDKMGFHQRRVGSAVVLVALALVAVTVGRRVSAAEALDDLGVQLRLVELVPANGPAGPSKLGVAKVEVLVQAFRSTSDLELRILHADGSTWKVKGRPIESGRPAWADPSGEPLEPGADGLAIPARGAIRTTIVVPLDGAAIHEIVVAVTGLVGGEPIATEAVVRVAWGVPDNQPVDDGTYANFTVSEVR